jgi:acyl dehydratase
MAIDPKFKGKHYGPFVYEVGLEKIREFAVAISPSPLSYSMALRLGAEGIRPVYHDIAAGKASRHGSVIAPPTFCVNFAMQPFLQAAFDPDLAIDPTMLLHGEQEFEFREVVRPGDVVTTTGTIADIYEKAGKDFVVVKSESRDQRNRVLVLGTWTAVVRRAA